MTVFSLHPVKIITIEGGVITTNSKNLQENLYFLENTVLSEIANTL